MRAGRASGRADLADDSRRCAPSGRPSRRSPRDGRSGWQGRCRGRSRPCCRSRPRGRQCVTVPVAVARTGSPISPRKSMPVWIAGRPRNGSSRTPKRRTHIDLAGNRLAHRHGDQSVGVSVDFGARDVDAIELTVEGAGARTRRLNGTNGPPRAVPAVLLAGSTPRSLSTLRMRRALVSTRLFQIGQRRKSAGGRPCRARRKSRPSMPSSPSASLRLAMRVMVAGNSRDSSRASRSGGAVKITVSLIGEALTGLSNRQRVVRGPQRAGRVDVSRRAPRCGSPALPAVATAR